MEKSISVSFLNEQQKKKQQTNFKNFFRAGQEQQKIFKATQSMDHARVEEMVVFII